MSGPCSRRTGRRHRREGSGAGLDAGLKLIEILGGTKLAQQVQQDTQYYPDPPVSSEIPASPAACPIPAGAHLLPKR